MAFNSPDNLIEWYVDGEVTLWFSLEVVSFSGDIHFYVRTPTKHRNIVEALFYANYPEIEIVDAEDYMDTLPRTVEQIEESGYQLWGTELRLAREDAYPIRTYEEFKSVVEEEQLDPVSALMEVFGKMSRGEKLMLQILIRPADHEWRKEGLKVINEIKMSTAYLKKSRDSRETGLTEDVEDKIQRTPGETDMLKAMDRNVSKSGYETVIRYLYMAPKDVYAVNLPKRGVFACFNQYATLNMNYFKHNSKVRTETWWVKPPFIFPARRLVARRRRLLRNFRKRRMPEENVASKIATSEFFDWNVKSKVFVLNTEELATVWHLPSHLVLTAPLVRRVDSRKMGAPAGLPIFGEDGQKSPWDAPKK